VSDDVAKLRERIDLYRRKSEFIPLRPIAAAYGDAADQLEDMIKARTASPGR
jgi:hypothetical protein